MLHRIEATVRPENAPSRAVLAKAGFREEGLLKRYLEVDGAWRDHLLVAHHGRGTERLGNVGAGARRAAPAGPDRVADVTYGANVLVTGELQVCN